MSSAGELVLLPNLGGEEGSDWQRMADRPPVAAAAALWGSLFGSSARLGAHAASPHQTPAFDWLPTHGGALAWFGDPCAAADPALAGRPWRGCDPSTVSKVHDKAFALRHGSAPPALRGVARCFEPAELEHPDAAIAAIARALDEWPAGLRDRFCLKPRFGSSGRGRALGRGDTPDTPALRGALPRLAARGGAILEPWLERTVDLSVSFHVRDAQDGPPLELLGSLVALSTAAGVPRGHRGEVDRRGRVHCGSPFDDALREAGSELTAAAAEAGYRGPCGVDGFAFRDAEGHEILRPTVELNARFTLGIVALGCLRRARTWLREALDIEPEQRVGVLVAYEAPGRDWNELDPEVSEGLDALLPIEICPPADPRRGPAILAARDPARLDAIADALVRAPGRADEEDEESP